MFITLRCHLCLSHCDHGVMFITLLRLYMFVVLGCYNVCDDMSMFVMLQRHGYIHHIATSIYVRHITTLLCLVDCNVTCLTHFDIWKCLLHCDVFHHIVTIDIFLAHCGVGICLSHCDERAKKIVRICLPHCEDNDMFAIL
jgi:hypothetical protein